MQALPLSVQKPPACSLIPALHRLRLPQHRQGLQLARRCRRLLAPCRRLLAQCRPRGLRRPQALPTVACPAATHCDRADCQPEGSSHQGL